MNEAAATPPSLSMQLLSTALALALVLLLAWAGLKLLKRLQTGRAGASPSTAPVVLHSVSLGPRERLVSVRHRGREYLLGVTPGAISVIDADVRPAPLEGSPNDAARGRP